jgi:putative restriction endonuclease
VLFASAFNPPIEVLEFFAQSIQCIHKLAPNKWGLTQYDKGLRLNAGFSEVLTVFESAVQVLVLEDELPAALNFQFEVIHRYPSTPGSALLRIPLQGAGSLQDTLDAIRVPHEQVLRVAAQRGFNLGSKKGHRPDAVVALAETVGFLLPQPAYVAESPSLKSRRRFGDVPDHPEGTLFESRETLKDAGLHSQLQSGISGSKEDGADAIVLSGGYEDDTDEGDIILYTGQGGRDPSTGQQVAHQQLERGNLWLVISHQRGLPIRVIRGAKHKSPYSPSSGYQYNGLYRVDDHWSDGGRAGFRVFRYRLVKLGNATDIFSETERAPEMPARRDITVSRIIRNSQRAHRVKVLHDYTCQVCGVRLESPNGPYAEAAHIRPLGLPHNGPDDESNILCLCPNHHVLFDFGALTVADDLQFIGYPGTLRLHPQHRIDVNHIRYHRDRYGTVLLGD